MTTSEPIPDINPCTEASHGFQHFVGGFVIDAPCNLCKNKTVYVHDLYDLIDFTDNGGFNVRKVRFFHAYLKGFKVTLALLDMKTGELLKRSHRLDNDELACNWVLTDLFTKPEPEEQLFQDFRERK